MASNIRLRSFRRIRKNLVALNIKWDSTRGKGSHGCFIGPHQETGTLNTYPIPKDQQREINIDYIKRLRRRFGLTDKKWDYIFE